MAEAVHGLLVCEDGAAVAGDIGIYPGFIDIAVKDFAPDSAAGDANAIIETVEGGKMHDHEYVVSFAFDPAMKSKDTILIAHMDDAETLSAQPWVTPA